MKPVKLTMFNIGPYKAENGKGQTIDFTQLENIFLIAGDTGAGKTFIFDSMTYALYGKLCGSRDGCEKDLKSHFAEADEDSYVEFTFELAEGIYKVCRAVAYEYVNRNGKKSFKDAEVELSRMIPDGSFEFISSAKTEVNSKISDELIKLSADEFAKIVLLPQGAFSDFLKQSSTERAETLKKLFPIPMYENAKRQVKEKLNSREAELKGKIEMINSVSKGFDFTDAENFIKNHAGEIEVLERSQSENVAKSGVLNGEIAALEGDLESALQGEKNKQRLEELKKDEDKFRALGKKIEAADKASPFEILINSKNEAEKEVHQSELNLVNAVQTETSSRKALEELKSKTAEMDSLKAELATSIKELNVLETKLTEAKKLSAVELKKAESEKKKSLLESLLKESETKVAQIRQKYIDGKIDEFIDQCQEKMNSLITQEADLKIQMEVARDCDNLKAKIETDSRQLELESVKKEEKQKYLEKSEEVLNSLREKLEEFKKANAAYEVSLLLKKDCPCPVCGSTVHPSPAKKCQDFMEEAAIKTAEETVAEIQKELNELESECKRLLLKIDENRQSLAAKNFTGSYIELCSVLDKNISDKEKILKELESAKNDRIESDRLTLEYDAVRNDLTAADKELSNACVELKNLRQLVGDEETEQSLALKITELSAKTDADQQTLDDWLKKCADAEKAYSGATSSKNVIEMNLNDAKNKLSASVKTLDEKIRQSDFANEKQILEVMIETQQLAELRKQFEEYNSDLKTLTELVKNNRETRASAEIKILADDKKNQLSLVNEKLASLTEEIKVKSEELTAYRTSFNSVKQAEEDRKNIEKEIEPLRLLSADLSGDNPKKLPFENWALGIYFEEILGFASRRFEKISSGRFRFEIRDFSDGKGNSLRGLDFMVLDSYTDRYLEPKELSGGESFEASISLALAITDVVQNSNASVQLDSLFIDEGFGTLDSETLDMAMSVLSDLGQHKMVGIISHVEGLQDTDVIQSFITVKKTTKGSTVSTDGQ